MIMETGQSDSWRRKERQGSHDVTVIHPFDHRSNLNHHDFWSLTMRNEMTLRTIEYFHSIYSVLPLDFHLKQ